MSFTKDGKKNIDGQTKFGEEDITEEDVRDIISEYEEGQRIKESTERPENSFKKRKVIYNQEKAKENFESGKGSFRRS